MTYSFRCGKCGDFDRDYSFKEFDQIKANTLVVKCDCGKNVEMLMGGIGLFVYMSDPRTLGSLAERNSKYRIREEEEKDEQKREKRKAEGKHVAPKQIEIPWDAPEKKNFDNKEIMKDRKERKKEYVSKYKPSKRSPRSPNKSGPKSV